MRGSAAADGTKDDVMHVQMVRVAVETLWTEGEDDVRADRPMYDDELWRLRSRPGRDERPRMLG